MAEIFEALPMCITCRYRISAEDNFSLTIGCSENGPDLDEEGDCRLHGVKPKIIAAACSSISRVCSRQL